MMGYLEDHIRSLVRQGWARRPADVCAWLNVGYRVSYRAVAVTMARLARRGVIRRVRRGVYDAAE